MIQSVYISSKQNTESNLKNEHDSTILLYNVTCTTVVMGVFHLIISVISKEPREYIVTVTD